MDWIFHILIAVIAGILIVTFIAQITVVNGSSMFPTLQNGNILLTEKISQRFGAIHRGDIVTLYVPEFLEEGKSVIIKRVIGVAGDTVEVKDGKVFVNGKQLTEKYINGNYTEQYKGDPSHDYNKVTVQKGYIYVLGDNRLPNASKDSRIIGPVPLSKLRGKAFFRIYPFNKIGSV
ncbi:MAG: signal peptidase I [Bacillota bacterium]|nr:signal peptidase I [Bacillota bacterium]